MPVADANRLVTYGIILPTHIAIILIRCRRVQFRCTFSFLRRCHKLCSIVLSQVGIECRPCVDGAGADFNPGLSCPVSFQHHPRCCRSSNRIIAMRALVSPATFRRCLFHRNFALTPLHPPRPPLILLVFVYALKLITPATQIADLAGI